MGKSNSKSGTTVNKAPKTTRHYTVGYSSYRGIKKPAPQLIIDSEDIIKAFFLADMVFKIEPY